MIFIKQNRVKRLFFVLGMGLVEQLSVCILLNMVDVFKGLGKVKFRIVER